MSEFLISSGVKIYSVIYFTLKLTYCDLKKKKKKKDLAELAVPDNSRVSMDFQGSSRCL